MNKFNKKGFTLIEMLVVIAIIAVLVSIVIPTVSSSTAKAQAATNAANLRSLKAELTTAMLTTDSTTGVTVRNFTVTSTGITPASADSVTNMTFKGEGSVTVEGNLTSGLTVKFAGKTIDQWAAVAEGKAT